MKTQITGYIPAQTSIKKALSQPDNVTPIVVFLKIFPSIQSLVIALIIMFAINWKMALIILAFTPAPSLIACSFSLRHFKRTIILMNKRAMICIGLNEAFVFLIIVHNFARTNNEKVPRLPNLNFSEHSNKIIIESKSIKEFIRESNRTGTISFVDF